MSVQSHDDWSLSEKGMRDGQRHREKIDDQIRKNVKDVISDMPIITRKGGKTVKIPVKGLKDFRFKHGISDDTQRGGVGQGKGKAGDVIARKEGKDPTDGKPGNERGEEYMETEVDLDYLIKLMFDDLGLPYIEEKTRKELLVPAGWKFETVSKVGIPPRLHKKRTILEGLKRTANYVAEIIDVTKCAQENAERALSQSKGDLDIALEIVKNNEIDMSISPDDLYLEDDDMRFRQIEQEFDYQSNAVIIAAMDISGSMTPDKKYLARSFLFWMNEFLKKAYDNVQIRFIVHTTEARFVDEKDFFLVGEWGGTMCHTAYDLADYTFMTEYPADQWNRYFIAISDGEDFDVNKTVSSAKTLIKNGLNMLGYLQVTPGPQTPYEGTLLKEFRKSFDMKAISEDGRTFFKSEKDHFVACNIKGKEDVYPSLRCILFEKEKKK